MGPVACRNAGTITSDGQGNTRCCQEGSSMQSFVSFVNGQQINNCTCTRFLGGNGGGFQFFSGVNVDPNFNATAFARDMEAWSQRFSQSMQNMASNLRRNLGNVNNNLRRTLGNMASNLRRNLNNMNNKLRRNLGNMASNLRRNLGNMFRNKGI